ncbi:MAG: DUF2889 domain-containing protein [Proteobacteria bacterium]|nr:DUF2889 domain-containing protein [Pseudomonadota bacterium]
MDFIFRTINSNVQEINKETIVIMSQLTDFAHIFEVMLAVDIKTRKIVEAKGNYYKTPYKICQQTQKLIPKLKGLTVNKGILKEIQNILSGKNGCVHLYELVENAIKLASTILIGKHINYFSEDFKKLPDDEKIKLSKQYLKNTCYAYKE